jgi:hypothetical protein
MRHRFVLLGLLLAMDVAAQAAPRPVLAADGLAPAAAAQALQAVECARRHGAGVDATRLAIIDYDLPSRQPRLWVFDLDRGTLLFREHVAHGRNSGADLATDFSNRAGSRQSSLGLFLTADTYQGGNGYSLRMHGLSGSLNDNAYERLIVMHGADYVDAAAAQRQGRLGRSWGCPAVRTAVAVPLIDSLRGGQFLFAHGPGSEAAASCPGATGENTAPATPGP